MPETVADASILANVPTIRQLQDRYPGWTNDRHLAEQERLAVLAFGLYSAQNAARSKESTP